jgi:hypothetical protein
MQRSTRLAAASASLVAALVITVAPAGAASKATTRWVDGDGHASPGDCGGSGSAFRHIQAAVTASDAGDTVVVCPGTYTEQVTIQGNRDGLTLKSSRPFGATIKTPTSLDHPYDFTYLVLVNKVDDVTIRGFKTIVRTSAPCDDVDGTIVVVGGRHASIRGNRLLAPGAGAGQCLQSDGIVIVDGTGPVSARSSSATVGFNEVRDALFIAIGAFGQDRMVDVDIVHNSVRAYFGQGIIIPTSRRSASLGSPAGAPAPGAEFGIALFGRTKGVVRDNVVQGATSAPSGGPTFFAGIGISPSFVMSSVPFSNGPIDVRDNTVRRVVFAIEAQDADRLTIERNGISNAYVGIEVQRLTDSFIRRNSVVAKAMGVSLDATSHGNAVRRNTVSGNGGVCTDGSTGGGTAGTANTWADNTASVGSNPTGICAVAP